MQNTVRSTRVRLPGRTAREDVDAGDARRARAMEGPSQSLPLRQIQNPALAGFFVSDEEVGQMQNTVRSTRVRLPGRRAREDVDAGDARRARAMEGPSQSLPLKRTPNPALAGFFVSDEEVGQMQNTVRSTRVRLPGRRAREDVDAGDARRARAMEGPSQSLPLERMEHAC